MGCEGVVGIVKREEKGMIYDIPSHLGFGIGTNSKKCILRNVETGLVSPIECEQKDLLKTFIEKALKYHQKQTTEHPVKYL